MSEARVCFVLQYFTYRMTDNRIAYQSNSPVKRRICSLLYYALSLRCRFVDGGLIIFTGQALANSHLSKKVVVFIYCIQYID